MTCASCVGIIENILSTEDGIISASVNLATERAKVIFNPDKIGARKIISTIEDVGYSASILSKEREENSRPQQLEVEKLKKLFLQSLIFTIPIFMLTMVIPMAAMDLHHSLQTRIFNLISWNDFLIWILSTPVQFWLGKKFYVGAIKILKIGGANMDVLVATATSAAYFYSVLAILIAAYNPSFQVQTFFDTSSTLICFILLGKYLEAVAKGKASDAITKLMSLKSSTAILIEKNGIEKIIDANLIQKGDILKVI